MLQKKEFPGKDPFRPDRLLQWKLVSLKLYLLQNLEPRDGLVAPNENTAAPQSRS